MELTVQQLISIIGSNKTELANNLIKSLNDNLKKYEINTKQRICHFLAQVLHESSNFYYVKENLNYSAKGLVAVFPKYFPNLEMALQYQYKPEKIANKIYSLRMGNGDEASGDGYRYCGRGFIQTTGLNNYKAFSKYAGIDCVNKPELLETIQYAIESACYFWKINNLNTLSDSTNKNEDVVLSITKIVNGGTNGYDDRLQKFNICFNVL